MRTPLVARISTAALVEGSMQMSEAACVSPRRDNSTQCAQHATTPQRAKHKNSRYFLVIANVVIKQLLLPQAANVTIRR
jgi:hypothetical protein